MRMLGYLKNTYKCNEKDTIYKIVLHKTEKEVYVYLYTSFDAVLSSFDNWYPDKEFCFIGEISWQKIIRFMNISVTYRI